MKTAITISTDDYDIYGNPATLHRSFKDSLPSKWEFRWVNTEGTTIQAADIYVQEMISCLRIAGYVVTR